MPDSLAAEKLLRAIQARGSDATDLRDAAHEAHHAIFARVKGRWTRKNIDRALQKLHRSDRVGDEMRARAVEQLVCRFLGVDPGTVEKWAGISCLESMQIDKLGIPYDAMMEGVQRRLKDSQAHAQAVLRLAES